MGNLEGKFAGQVFDNLDPKKLGRVKALCDGAGFTRQPTPWAFPASARSKGDFEVPEIGDNVWIEFEGDPPDANRPIYSPGFWSEPGGQSEVPDRARGQGTLAPAKGADTATSATGATLTEPTDPFGPAVYPRNRVLETPAGHLIEYDDTPGKERIHIWHKSGSFIEFHPDGKIVSRSTGDRYVYVQTNDVLHVLQDLDLVADVKMGIASPQVTVKASTKAKVDSPLVELGSGTLLNLIDTRIITIFNLHTHSGVQAGPGTSGPPSTTITDPTTVSTQNTKAS
jgi:hypothetical protein